MVTAIKAPSSLPHLDLSAAGVEGDVGNDVCAVGGEPADRVCCIVEPQMVLVDSRKRRLVDSDYHCGFSAFHRGLSWKKARVMLNKDLLILELDRVRKGWTELDRAR